MGLWRWGYDAGSVLVFLLLLIPLAVLGGLAALVYFLVRGSRTDDAFSSRALLRAYLRLAYLVSLVVFLVGAVNLLTAGFAAAFGHDFSYQPPYTVSPALVCPVPGPNATEAARAAYEQCLRNRPVPTQPPDTRAQDDVIRGLSLMVSGLLIGAGHRAGQRMVESPDEWRYSGLARLELLACTVGFGLVTITVVPVASYSVLHHVILGDQASTSGSSPDAPGSALATAVVFLPAWLYHLATFVQRSRATRPAPTP